MDRKFALLLVLVVAIHMCLAVPSKRGSLRLPHKRHLKASEWLLGVAKRYAESSNDECYDLNAYSCVHHIFFTPNEPCNEKECPMTCGICEDHGM
ncbi:hypothetical protein AC249_AIPGENE9233 [Exaiptasia diaphana]|nr:hypothetical protein AC249_AIPGENE9233 [Exaiptasia diaphana]